MLRQEVYRILDDERDYQDQKWGGKAHDKGNEVFDFTAYMSHYLDKAKLNPALASEELRKVVALGIACFETHGVPERESVKKEEDAS